MKWRRVEGLKAIRIREKKLAISKTDLLEFLKRTGRLIQ